MKKKMSTHQKAYTLAQKCANERL